MGWGGGGCHPSALRGVFLWIGAFSSFTRWIAARRSTRRMRQIRVWVGPHRKCAGKETFEIDFGVVKCRMELMTFFPPLFYVFCFYLVYTTEKFTSSISQRVQKTSLTSPCESTFWLFYWNYHIRRLIWGSEVLWDLPWPPRCIVKNRDHN